MQLTSHHWIRIVAGALSVAVLIAVLGAGYNPSAGSLESEESTQPTFVASETRETRPVAGGESIAEVGTLRLGQVTQLRLHSEAKVALQAATQQPELQAGSVWFAQPRADATHALTADRLVIRPRGGVFVEKKETGTLIAAGYGVTTIELLQSEGSEQIFLGVLPGGQSALLSEELRGQLLGQIDNPAQQATIWQQHLEPIKDALPAPVLQQQITADGWLVRDAIAAVQARLERAESAGTLRSALTFLPGAEARLLQSNINASIQDIFEAPITELPAEPGSEPYLNSLQNAASLLPVPSLDPDARKQLENLAKSSDAFAQAAGSEANPEARVLQLALLAADQPASGRASIDAANKILVTAPQLKDTETVLAAGVVLAQLAGSSSETTAQAAQDGTILAFEHLKSDAGTASGLIAAAETATRTALAASSETASSRSYNTLAQILVSAEQVGTQQAEQRAAALDLQQRVKYLISLHKSAPFTEAGFTNWNAKQAPASELVFFGDAEPAAKLLAQRAKKNASQHAAAQPAEAAKPTETNLDPAAIISTPAEAQPAEPQPEPAPEAAKPIGPATPATEAPAESQPAEPGKIIRPESAIPDFSKIARPAPAEPTATEAENQN